MKMVYHLGIDAGFFAEFKYLVHALMYCEEHGESVSLYSEDANFGYTHGWEDYFEAFCPIVTSPLHHYLNHHRVPAAVLRNNLPWRIKLLLRHYLGKCLLPKTLLNSDLEITDDFLCNDYLQRFNSVVDRIWHYNTELTEYVETCKCNMQLPADYVACQIRGGDKITEVSLYSPAKIINTIRSHYETKNVFVLTDDYRIYEEICETFPDMHFYTLCSPDERGYVNKDFSATLPEKKKMQMFRFLASIDIMLHSQSFIGSITTGPSVFVLQRKYPDCLPLDCDKAAFPAVSRLTIRERGEIANRYMQEEAVPS